MRKNCQEPYFTQIATGRKTVEGRINRDDWAAVCVGDKIEFYYNDNSIICEVVAIHHEKDFASLYRRFGDNLLPGISSEDEAMAIYHQFYTVADEERYGVVGIEIKV